MPYRLTWTCELCEKQTEQPMGTLREVYLVGKLFLSRAAAMIATGAKPTTLVKPLCSSCERTPPTEGHRRVGGGGNLGDPLVTFEHGKAKPE